MSAAASGEPAPADPLVSGGRIQPWHRERLAMVYVRQSTPQQVADLELTRFGGHLKIGVSCPVRGVPMAKTHPPYAPEYRAEAVRLVREGGRTPRELAAELGCSEEAIRSWARQADLDEGRRADGLTSAERGELADLRRENRVLRMERDLLKKAAAFFARESEPTR